MSKPDWVDELSPAAAGCYLLLWQQQPTDRALTGWWPWGDISCDEGNPADIKWMAGLLRSSLAERSSLDDLAEERARQEADNRRNRQ